MRFEFFDANARIGSVPNQNPAHGATVDELLREMDTFGIAEAAVWHAWANRWDIKIGNAELLRQTNGHRDRLHPSWVVMHEHTGQMPEGPLLVGRMLDAGVRVARLFFSTWGSSHEYLPWAYTQLLGALEHARMPLIIEWENHPPVWNDLAQICQAYPNLPVILTHSKLTQWERNWFPLLGTFPNFHIETAGYQAWRGLEGLCRHFSARQVIFGTRYPLYQVGQSMSMLARTLRPEDERAMMAAGNLRKLMAEVNR